MIKATKEMLELVSRTVGDGGELYCTRLGRNMIAIGRRESSIGYCGAVLALCFGFRNLPFTILST